MDLLWGGLTFAPGRGFPLSTDSMVLADFVRLPRAARVVDLGSGGGLLGLLLCGKAPDCTVTGVELQAEAHQAALDNIARNRLDRLSSILGDLRQVRTLLPGGVFSSVVSNPPYFSGGLPSAGVAGPQARQERTCTLSDVYEAAAWLLRFGGDCFLVHRPERAGRSHGSGPSMASGAQADAAGASQARRSGQFGSAPMPPGGEAGAVPAAGPHPVPC